ncbi:MAG: proline--tRNA ligase [Pseudomonadota bacterium]
MRFSTLLCPTLKEDPAEAETPSHRLMLRAGMIRQIASGIYDVLPVGLRVLRKVEQIVREEMNRAGAQEVYLPAVQPAELWKESGRWEALGKEMLRFQDRSEREYCFGPTHEEVITDLVRREIHSYRDLPKNLYQIQVKFRDEVRPRFGLMRCREFVMKDAYSFDADQAGAEESYRRMRDAYTKIFSRCGLNFTVVEADSGNIGGSMSQEFMVLASTGEDELLRCPSCDYSANVEKADGAAPARRSAKFPKAPEKKPTPGKRSVEEVSEFLGVPPECVVKMLVYKTEEEYVAVLLPGDREANEVRLKAHLNANILGLASGAEILRLTQVPVGFVGPVGLKITKDGIRRVLSDNLIEQGEPYVVGGNAEDTHWVGSVAGKDFDLGTRLNLHRTRGGDLCPKCKTPLHSDRGIEVGHIFMLGTKYSESMKAVFTDKDGASRPAIMGCYGIGIGRTAAAAIEQNNDENGIIFPAPLAPFDVAVVCVDWQRENHRKEAERVYAELQKEGFDVLLDDRDFPPGRKFKDIDLLGIPARVTIGEKALAQGKLEVKTRREPKGTLIDPSALIPWLREALK